MRSLITQGVKLLATGSAVPDLCITNQIISNIVDTSDEWIFDRTGIRERRIVSKGQSIIDLAVKAANKALIKAHLEPLDLDLIILATSTPNDLFGSASQLQLRLGALQAAAFDITAACSGFIIASVTAAQFIQNGTYSNVLVVGADVLSQWTNWSDRRTCILFGDGAGAAIFQATSVVNNNFLAFQLNTDGKQYNQLNISYKNTQQKQKVDFSDIGSFDSISMNGREVYKFAVSKIPQSIQFCLDSVHISIEKVDWLLLHQANIRILNAVAKRLMIPYAKVISNLSKYGNTSAASIPLALDEAIEEAKVSCGDLIVMSGFGAGLTWGTLILKWQD
uniref:Beta-ketoacyl-[acyl-carrier-protein] synthase III n=1 Tax=Neogoniolithon spectabile TaxID=231755 RepID=A0A3G3MH46_9FLOR|nr:3-oxoacyl-acyl-carrier-protein synthase 3 [Neogoniolithon spectabile]AYR06159.1 3-oxoacyl-acyl-carrier-protein synthase 3 [Neogoniolithon spectabile]